MRKLLFTFKNEGTHAELPCIAPLLRYCAAYMHLSVADMVIMPILKRPSNPCFGKLSYQLMFFMHVFTLGP
jgi:hypothetical protein